MAFIEAKTDGKKLLIVIVGAMIALAVHQKFVAPRLAPKAKV